LLSQGAGQKSYARARYYQAATSLMWNLGGLLISLIVIFGEHKHPTLLMAAAVLHFIGGAFFPPAFLALWRKASDEGSTRAIACRILCWISIVSAVILTLGFVSTCRRFGLPPGAVGFGYPMGTLLSWHVAAVMGFGALLLLPGRLNDFVSRFYAVTTLIGASVPALMTLATSQLDLLPPMLPILTIAHQSPLLILLGAIIFFADFRLSNVFVKTSLQLLTALMLALGFCLLITGPMPQLVGRITDYPAGLLISSATVMLVLFLWAFVWINPILSRMVDRWLFREPDYKAATRELWERLSPRGGVERDAGEETEEIFRTVARFVCQTLELEEARVIPVNAVEADHLEAALNSGEVCQLGLDDPVKRKLGAGVEFLAPVRVKGRPTHLLAITPGAKRRHMLESEIRFVRAVAGQVSSRLETLQFEKEMTDRRNKEERLRRQITEAKLLALRAQINPHFLFNSLNTLADLIVTDPARAERMTVHLSKVFRHVLSASDRQMISVAEEIEFLRTYLDIEAMRFGDRLCVNFDVDRAVTNEVLPSLILQPLVENALKHGLAQKIGPGTLRVIVKKENGYLRLTVEDDGPGFAKSPPIAGQVVEADNSTRQAQNHNGSGVGLRNTTERLATIYSGQAKILFEDRAGGGSSVTLLLPSPVACAL
jgi:two-component system LytT family sensor kinase